MTKLAIAHQAEGMTSQRLEEKSAEKVGSMDEWRRDVVDKLQGGDPSMQSAAKFLNDRNWTGADSTKPQGTSAFQDLINTQGYSSAKNGLPSSLGMMKYLGPGLIYDTGWQPKTSVSYVTSRYTAADKKAGTIPKGKDVGDAKTEEYVNPEQEPGVVARNGVDGGLGSFARVGDDSNPLRYARVIDAKPGGSAAAEINNATGYNLGDYGFDPNTSSGSVDVNVVSANPSNRTGGLELSPDGRLSNEQTQYAGWLAENKGASYGDISSQSALSKTMDKYKDDDAFKKYQQDVKDALDKQKKELDKRRKQALDDSISKGGGDRVEKGVRNVLGGVDRREIVTVASVTQSGDTLKEGRYGTYASEQRLPVSTLGSLTQRGQAVVTALDNVHVFGPPTSESA